MKKQTSKARITATDLTLAYGPRVIMQDMNFAVNRGEVFVIMGGSGCGKSTLLKSMVGLIEPAAGEVAYDGVSFTHASPEERQSMQQSFGILYQSGALWGSMSLAENIALPLEQYTALSKNEIRDLAAFKLALVGLNGFEDYYPAEISGGMRKRAALARAMALDPDILFFDEPSAGLDPISSARLDELIVQLRDSLDTTVVMVTHELASIFAIGDHCIYLDAQTKRILAEGSPHELAENAIDKKVVEFLHRRPESMLSS